MEFYRFSDGGLSPIEPPAWFLSSVDGEDFDEVLRRNGLDLIEEVGDVHGCFGCSVYRYPDDTAGDGPPRWMFLLGDCQESWAVHADGFPDYLAFLVYLGPILAVGQLINLEWMAHETRETLRPKTRWRRRDPGIRAETRSNCGADGY